MKKNLILASAAGVVGFAVLSVLIIAFPGVGTAITLALIASTLLAGLLMVDRRLRRGATDVRNLRSKVIENHKRASEWDWRLNERLNGVAGVRPARGGVDAPAGLGAHPLSAALADSVVFSRSFYEAASGMSFAGDVEAADHYLRHAMPQLLEPNAFLDCACFPEFVRQAMRRGRAEELLEYLASEGPFGPGLGALGEEAADGLGPLARFLSSVDEESLLPAEGSPLQGVRALDYARAVEESARTSARAGELDAPRLQDAWDGLAESELKADLRRHQLDSEPLVSVIMPVRNRAGVVGRAVTSVREQSYSEWELIVVDDGSTDGTLDLVREMASRDPRIRVTTRESSGVSAARNAGIAQARGSYVAFLDSDNVWRRDFLELMVRAMERDDLPWAYAAIQLNGERVQYRCFEGGRDALLLLNHVDANVMLVRSELVRSAGGFDESMRRWVDHDLSLRLARCVEPALVRIIGCEYSQDDSAERITNTESDHWQWVALGNGIVDWDAARAKNRVRGRVSIIIPTHNDAEMTLAAVGSVREACEGDVEIVVVDNGSARPVSLRLARHLSCVEGVRLHRLPKNYNFAIACNAGAAEATGEFLLFLNNDTTVRRGDPTRITEALADPRIAGVQPLLVYPDDTIQSAGTVWIAPDALPVHLLAGHPAEDAQAIGSYAFSAVTGAAMAVRAPDFLGARGFDPLYVNGMEDVDLCLRLLRERPGGFLLDAGVTITHLEGRTPGRSEEIPENRKIFMARWRSAMPEPDHGAFERAGFRIAHVGAESSQIELAGPRPLLVRENSRRRWGIVNPAIAGRRGDAWGDTHYVDALARSLRGLGEDVVTYRHESQDCEATIFDDVRLAIRGKDRVRANPGAVNVLWVISHPDDVTVEELRGFDMVYAASEAWARRMSERTGIEIGFLPQATDASAFSYAASQPEVDLVFVGGIHVGRTRGLVNAAIESGASMRIYGPGWEGLVSDALFAGEYVPNEELASVYRSARFVIADHWEDMAAEGFVQNRVFDAVAAGVRVITQPMEGLDIVEGAAIACENAQDISRALARPTDGDLEEIATRVASLHSFDVRAARLVEEVSRRG